MFMSDSILPLGNIFYGSYHAGFAGNVFSPEGISPAMSTMGGATANH